MELTLSNFSKLIALAVYLIAAVSAVALAAWFKQIDLLDQFVIGLKSYDVGGILTVVAVVLALNFRTEMGKTCLILTLVGVALIVVPSMVLTGLPALGPNSPPELRDVYGWFGAALYLGVITALTFSVLSLIEKSKESS